MAHAASSRPSSPRSWRTGYASWHPTPALGPEETTLGREGVRTEFWAAECLGALGRGSRGRGVGRRCTKRAPKQDLVFGGGVRPNLRV